MRKIDDLVIKLLEYDLRPTPQGGWEITEEMRALIHEIAEECNGLEIVKRVTEGKEEWLEQATPEEIYIHMLKKIVEAPTRMHMICVPRVLIPLIDQKLRENEEIFPHVVDQEAEMFINGEWKRGELLRATGLKTGS